MTHLRPLILIGGGGHCESVIEAAESAGATIAGILDISALTGTRILGYPVIGTDDEIPALAATHDFIVTVGGIKNLMPRRRLHHMVTESGGRLATVIASGARVSRHATLGAGTVVLHGACVNAGASVGEGCIINTLAAVEHDTVVGDYCHISTGAMINGGCRIGDLTFVGSGSVVAECTAIGPQVTIGAGSVVLCDITMPGIYAGSPAKLLHT